MMRTQRRFEQTWFRYNPTQASDPVNIDGGAIDGAVIGGNPAAAGSFTTINASGTITGNLTGAVTGNAPNSNNISKC